MTEILMTVLGAVFCFWAGVTSVRLFGCRSCYRQGFFAGSQAAFDEVQKQLTEQLGPDGFRIERVE